VWTVNDPRIMQRLVALGVDGIVTDRPDLAVGAIKD
jgi:glycerophosphoryl diester phosphodiesterase